MSRKRVRSTQRKGRRLNPTSASEGPGDHFSEAIQSRIRNPKHHRFIGVSLGGGKTDKTCVSVIEYYPDQRKIFLSRLFDKIKTEIQGEDIISADLQTLRLITQCPAPVENVSFDVPLEWPKCMRCSLRCPGFEACQETEIQWMWKHYREHSQKKKSPPRLFTPYTERCVEQYLQTELEEPFHLPHALGSNLAPLTARAQFLTRQLGRLQRLEVFPRLSLWRIGNALHLSKQQLRSHRHWEAGQGARQFVLNKMMDRNLAFIYDQDVKTLIDQPQAFDSFICALTGLLSFLGHCEPKPKGFPRRESWIAIPKKIFAWP